MEKLVVFCLSVVISLSAAQYDNSFRGSFGCLQYNAVDGYNALHSYFSTAAFRHIHSTANVTRIRLGVLGKNDGFFRLSPVGYPYDDVEMCEIILSGYANQRTIVRRYIRSAPDATRNVVVLQNQASNGLLSQLKPLFVTIEFHSNGSVKLYKDGDARPFLQFHDTKLSYNYIGFANWDVPVVYFFDCPVGAAEIE